jgi:hypothetical protein
MMTYEGGKIIWTEQWENYSELACSQFRHRYWWGAARECDDLQIGILLN